MDSSTQHLPFWWFFHELEKQLSYERWIDKYKLFLEQIYDNGYLDRGPDEYRQLLQLSKVLYLQDIRDERRFEQLFEIAWNKEKEHWKNTFQYLRSLAKEAEEKGASVNETPLAKEQQRGQNNPYKKEELAGNGQEKKPQPKEQTVNKDNGETKEYFYTPPVVPKLELGKISEQSETQRIAKSDFNLLDEYFVTTRREMNKAWQYLRHEEKGDVTSEIDIPATVKKLARETIFTSPVYVSGKKNRNDTLLIFADCNGSMVPFHELTRRLISSAKGFGGHNHAAVYYFQNYPLGYVYETANLTRPRKTVQAFATANKQFTTAVIISDAGFAREYGNEKRFESRIEKLQPFFEKLSDHCARTLWLNPMPENRWHKPTALEIQKAILRMAPILEKGNSLQNVMRNLVKGTHHQTNL